METISEAAWRRKLKSIMKAKIISDIAVTLIANGGNINIGIAPAWRRAAHAPLLALLRTAARDAALQHQRVGNAGRKCGGNRVAWQAAAWRKWRARVNWQNGVTAWR